MSFLRPDLLPHLLYNFQSNIILNLFHRLPRPEQLRLLSLSLWPLRRQIFDSEDQKTRIAILAAANDLQPKAKKSNDSQTCLGFLDQGYPSRTVKWGKIILSKNLKPGLCELSFLSRCTLHVFYAPRAPPFQNPRPWAGRKRANRIRQFAPVACPAKKVTTNHQNPSSSAASISALPTPLNTVIPYSQVSQVQYCPLHFLY